MLIFLQCLCSLFTGTFSRSCCRNAPLILQFYNRKYATRISMCVAAVACKLIGRISIETSSTFYIFVDAAVFTSTRRNFFDNDTMFFSTTWDTIQQHQFTRSLQSGSHNLLALSTLSSKFGRHAFSYCAPSVWNKLPLSIRRGVVVSGVRRMNEVNARRARLVPGWVTVRLRAGIPSRYVTSQLGQLSLASLRGR